MFEKTNNYKYDSDFNHISLVKTKPLLKKHTFMSTLIF